MFTLAPAYRAGQRFAIEVESIRERDGASRRVLEHVTLEVREVRPDATLLAWRPVWAETLEDTAPPEFELSEERLEELNRLWFEVVLDGQGKFLGIVNEPEVQALLSRVEEQILNALPLEAGPVAQVLTPQLLFGRLIRPLTLYFSLGGREFSFDAPHRRRGHIPNPFGGPAIAVEIATEARRGPEPDTFSIISEMTQPTRAIWAHLRSLGMPDLPPDSELDQLQLVDLTESVLDAARHWTRSVRFTRSCRDPRLAIFDFLEVRLRQT